MATARFVLDALPPTPARVLEVGCGAGELAQAVSAAGYQVVAVDPEAPEGAIFRRTTLEEFQPEGLFSAVIAAYSLHHVADLAAALDRIVSLLEPRGRLVIEEFGWDRLDQPTAQWYGKHQGQLSVESVLAEWRAEHEGLHGYDAMKRRLDERFTERAFEWRPYLYRCLERDELEPLEREAITRRDIRAVGFRFVGVRQ